MSDLQYFNTKQKKRALCYITSYLKVLRKPVIKNVITATR